MLWLDFVFTLADKVWVLSWHILDPCGQELESFSLRKKVEDFILFAIVVWYLAEPGFEKLVQNSVYILLERDCFEVIDALRLDKFWDLLVYLSDKLEQNW